MTTRSPDIQVQEMVGQLLRPTNARHSIPFQLGPTQRCLGIAVEAKAGLS